MGSAKRVLATAIANERKFVDCWRQPSVLTLFETVRAIDNLFLSDLFPTEMPERHQTEISYRSISSWGVNQALARVLPERLGHEPFVLFPSIPENQARADDLLFHGGILEKAEMLEGWLSEGLLKARLDVLPPMQRSGISNILVLKTRSRTLFRELISLEHQRWRSELIVERLRGTEHALEKVHIDIIPRMDEHLAPLASWGMQYTSSPEIDLHFAEWARLYLARKWGADIIGSDDRLGGRPFSEYLAVIVALSAKAQRHLAFSWRAKQRNPKLDFRNLLTTVADVDALLLELSQDLNADTLQVQQLLSSLTLEPANHSTHLARRETTWAPLIRASVDTYIVPVYGLDINPYLFLMRDLAAKYPGDWSRVANGRERRWQRELREHFAEPRWVAAEKGVKLRDGKTTTTDIDFAVFDSVSNEIAAFQLKWQQPVGHGATHRARRSAGANFVEESNRWVEAVYSWLGKHGASELALRLGLKARSDVRVHLFVLARYNAHYSGYGDTDERAAWCDWNHFLRLRSGHPAEPPSQPAMLLKSDVERLASEIANESYILPLQELAIVLNPTSEPRGSAAAKRP